MFNQLRSSYSSSASSISAIIPSSSTEFPAFRFTTNLRSSTNSNEAIHQAIRGDPALQGHFPPYCRPQFQRSNSGVISGVVRTTAQIAENARAALREKHWDISLTYRCLEIRGLTSYDPSFTSIYSAISLDWLRDVLQQGFPLLTSSAYVDD